MAAASRVSNESGLLLDVQVASATLYCYCRCMWGTGVRELTRGLATLPQRWIQEHLVARARDGRPQEDPLAVHCFCVCSGSALLGDLLGVNRSMERDLLSVLSIYPRIFLCVFVFYHLLVGFLGSTP